ncbi:MAG: cytochrome P450 [Nevskia sp.]|nr:cytochrome P450 [Nevskia sp.]
MGVMETVGNASAPPRPPFVRGLPLLGNMLEFAKDPALFFVKCYREYGPAFRVRVLGNTYTCIAGAEAASFMGTREGKECLRSREAWQPLVDEFGASKMLTAVDGELHKAMRGIMKRGFSKESIKGRYNFMIDITDKSIERDWQTGTQVPVVQAMQYMVVDQLGTVLTGSAPREYVKDIRTTILYILNVLVTRQRPKFMMKMPEYKRAKARMFELGRKMVADYRAHEAENLAKPDDQKTLIDDVMEAHREDPELIPERDLIMLMTGPYVAGLDTVANTTAAIVYTVLKYPGVLERVQKEVDALFAKGPVNEDEFMKSLPALNGAIMETMRLHPIAVAQIRTATKDFVFGGCQIKQGEMIYLGTAVPHFQDEFYPNADKFDIDRYTKERAEHMQVGAYSPYGRGPHTCLGKSLAEVLLAITMARLFYKLDLELVPKDYTLKTKTAPTPGPAMSFKVRVKGYRH